MHQDVPACGWEQIGICSIYIFVTFWLFLGSHEDFSPSFFLQEANLMASFGLSPGTLKGELFSILLNQGSNGMKVSELVKLPSVS